MKFLTNPQRVRGIIQVQTMTDKHKTATFTCLWLTGLDLQCFNRAVTVCVWTCLLHYINNFPLISEHWLFKCWLLLNLLIITWLKMRKHLCTNCIDHFMMFAWNIANLVTHTWFLHSGAWANELQRHKMRCSNSPVYV